MYIYIYVYICVCIYIYIHTHIHTHIYIHCQLEENQIEVSHTVKTQIKNFPLPSSACKPIHPCPKTSNFYMLPKIHKENCPGRPIVSTYDCPTVYISKFLDIILSPLVQELPSFIKDTPQFLQIINDFEY